MAAEIAVRVVLAPIVVRVHLGVASSGSTAAVEAEAAIRAAADSAEAVARVAGDAASVATAAAALSAHVAAPDPHTGYVRETASWDGAGGLCYVETGGSLRVAGGGGALHVLGYSEDDGAEILEIGATGLQSLAATTQASGRTALGLASLAASGSASDLSAGTVPAARLPAATIAAYGAVQLGVEVPFRVVLSADVQESAGVDAAVADLQHTPGINEVWFYEVWGVFATSANANGLQFRIDVGNAAHGAIIYIVQGASAVAPAQRVGTATSAPGNVLGTSGATGHEAPWAGQAMVTAAAAAPTAVQVYFRAENSGSTVTLEAGKCFLRRTRIS